MFNSVGDINDKEIDDFFSEKNLPTKKEIKKMFYEQKFL